MQTHPIDMASIIAQSSSSRKFSAPLISRSVLTFCSWSYLFGNYVIPDEKVCFTIQEYVTMSYLANSLLTCISEWLAKAMPVRRPFVRNGCFLCVIHIWLPVSSLSPCPGSNSIYGIILHVRGNSILNIRETSRQLHRAKNWILS